MKPRLFPAPDQRWFGRAWLALILATAAPLAVRAADRMVLCEEFMQVE